MLVTAAVAYVAPWQGLLVQTLAPPRSRSEQGTKAPLAGAHRDETRQWSRWGQVFSGNFVASSRLLFAFGRRGTIPARFGKVHESFLTPSVAIVGIALATIISLLLGDAILVRRRKSAP